VVPQIKLHLAWVAKYLCEVEVIWTLSQLKNGYDGELSFVIMTTNVIGKINNVCITESYIWLQGSYNKNTFDDIEHQQKVEISYKVNLGSNLVCNFLKVHNRNTNLVWKKRPLMLGLVSMFKAQYYTNVLNNEELV
jgi:hypothetical protein